MSTCLNHPDAHSTRPCVVCGDAFCLACLEPYPKVGAVCISCEQALDALPEHARLSLLPSLRQTQRAGVSPEPRLGRALLFWGLVFLPGVLVGVMLYRALQMHSLLEVWAEAPLLPGQAQERLLTIATALELARQHSGVYPERLEGLANVSPEAWLDPFTGKQLAYQVEASGYRLCSTGPDRILSNGVVLEPFSVFGDLCVRSRPQGG